MENNIVSNPVSTGYLRVILLSINESTPIANGSVSVSVSNPDQSNENVATATTNTQGQTNLIPLPTPNIEYSEQPSAIRPYSTYKIAVFAPGYEPIQIYGAQILPGEISTQTLRLIPLTQSQNPSAEVFTIPGSTLFEEFPPKIAESETKTVQETGEIVLSRVVVPEFIIVHDGPPSDKNATNYYVKYKDYIKNVASSEIYATWPEATIIANILAIQSFTLNRIYTEWYRNKGYNFNITTSTAYDQKWIYNRTIYENISLIVDGIFDQYLARPNITQPILTQYCDGNRVSCPNWLSQWGSKALGDQGYSASEIIKYYYGDSMYIATAEEISGVPASWPREDLELGSSGSKVAQLQRQLNAISKSYPLIPKISEDGVYGSQTANAIKIFQQIFNLPETGITDFTTWYKVSEIYVGVSRIAELV